MSRRKERATRTSSRSALALLTAGSMVLGGGAFAVAQTTPSSGKGANVSGSYDATAPTPSGNGASENNNGRRPVAGSVGKADDKNPPGQRPDGSDSNAGYECDTNQGIGQGNPAHTACETAASTPVKPGPDSMIDPRLGSSKNPTDNTSVNRRTDSSTNPAGGSSVNPRTGSSTNPAGGSSINPRTGSSAAGAAASAPAGSRGAVRGESASGGQKGKTAATRRGRNGAERGSVRSRPAAARGSQPPASRPAQPVLAKRGFLAG